MRSLLGHSSDQRTASHLDQCLVAPHPAALSAGKNYCAQIRVEAIFGFRSGVWSHISAADCPSGIKPQTAGGRKCARRPYGSGLALDPVTDGTLYLRIAIRGPAHPGKVLNNAAKEATGSIVNNAIVARATAGAN